MKVVIVGGIAAGLSAASQIKRQAPGSQVVVFEKSGDISYAACGMPYNLFYRDTPVESLYALTYDTIVDGRKVDYRLRNEGQIHSEAVNFPAGVFPLQRML